jgi:hypothetical protein
MIDMEIRTYTTQSPFRFKRLINDFCFEKITCLSCIITSIFFFLTAQTGSKT